MTTEVLDTNNAINISKTKANKKRKKIKANNTLVEKKEVKKDKIIAKKEREKTRTKRYLIIDGLLILNIALLIAVFTCIYYDLENKGNYEIKHCNSGYFKPEFSRENKNCKKCSVENCERCIGNQTVDFCTKCKPGFKSIY